MGWLIIGFPTLQGLSVITTNDSVIRIPLLRWPEKDAAHFWQQKDGLLLGLHVLSPYICVHTHTYCIYIIILGVPYLTIIVIVATRHPYSPTA